MKYLLSLILLVFLVSGGLWYFGGFSPLEAIMTVSTYTLALTLNIFIFGFLFGMLAISFIKINDKEYLSIFMLLTGSISAFVSVELLRNLLPAIAYKSFYGVPVYTMLNVTIMPFLLMAIFKFLRRMWVMYRQNRNMTARGF